MIAEDGSGRFASVERRAVSDYLLRNQSTMRKRALPCIMRAEPAGCAMRDTGCENRDWATPGQAPAEVARRYNARFCFDRLTLSVLSIIALSDATNRKIFVEVGPVEAKG
jgi:hypothetical protein